MAPWRVFISASEGNKFLKFLKITELLLICQLVIDHPQYVFEIPLFGELKKVKEALFKESFTITKPEQMFIINARTKSVEFTLDPASWLLFEYH